MHNESKSKLVSQIRKPGKFWAKIKNSISTSVPLHKIIFVIQVCVSE